MGGAIGKRSIAGSRLVIQKQQMNKGLYFNKYFYALREIENK